MDSMICFPYCCILRQLGNLSWLKITIHAPCSLSSVYLWSTCLLCPLKSSPRRTTTLSCCWRALLCKFWYIEIYMHGWFLLTRLEIDPLNLLHPEVNIFFTAWHTKHSLTHIDPGGKFLLSLQGRVETIQTTALLRMARILRRVLETWWDLQPLKLQWKTIS